MDVRASDGERDACVDQLRAAAAEGRLTFEELADRIEAATGAVMRGDLIRLTSDLPVTGGSGAIAVVDVSEVKAMGDIKRSGQWVLPSEARFRTWFGAIRLDLRQATITAPEVHIEVRSLFGSIDLLVPEGVAIDLQARPAIGNLKHEAGAEAPLGAPRIVITGGTAFGDVKVRHRRLWEKLTRLVA
jgi:hypothetical protein